MAVPTWRRIPSAAPAWSAPLRAEDTTLAKATLPPAPRRQSPSASSPPRNTRPHCVVRTVHPRKHSGPRSGPVSACLLFGTALWPASLLSPLRRAASQRPAPHLRIHPRLHLRLHLPRSRPRPTLRIALTPHYTTLHYTTPHCTSPLCTSIHYTTLHFTIHTRFLGYLGSRGGRAARRVRSLPLNNTSPRGGNGDGGTRRGGRRLYG